MHEQLLRELVVEAWKCLALGFILSSVSLRNTLVFIFLVAHEVVL